MQSPVTFIVHFQFICVFSSFAFAVQVNDYETKDKQVVIYVLKC